MPFAEVYRGKRVLVTGHTGFKGAWLCEWLLALGADVTGLALPPLTKPALFTQLDLADRMRHHLGDVREPAVVRSAVSACRPDFVFHLAAQPLVRLSYAHPVDTYATNVMGTIHLLEALRDLEQPCAAVMVTTDKCYENRELVHCYREEEPLGGFDPYSSSKAACEIAIASWRRSFFHGHLVKIASARAGNVIGGGDWALDRIVPDCMRSLRLRQAIAVRNPYATRPWQHVLEPLSGYLWLAACLSDSHLCPQEANLCSAFNFGPPTESNRTVERLVQEIIKYWPGRWEDCSDPKAVHEAKLLSLSVEKAWQVLNWKPTWNFAQALAHTVGWYIQDSVSSSELPSLTRRQIEIYVESARNQNIPWSQ